DRTWVGSACTSHRACSGKPAMMRWWSRARCETWPRARTSRSLPCAGPTCEAFPMSGSSSASPCANGPRDDLMLPEQLLVGADVEGGHAGELAAVDRDRRSAD